MKKKILVGVLVFVTVVGIAFAANKTKTYKCKQCGTNDVSSDGATCSSCLEKEKKEAERKRGEEQARRYDAADKSCKTSDYYDDCMKGWGY